LRGAQRRVAAQAFATVAEQALAERKLGVINHIAKNPSR